jgi:pimeloyl-ACP methyl ester carboxylesterase
MRRQLADGFTMEYEEAGTGTPVVLLHAFPLSSAMWRPQREALADDMRLILPNLRGFGATDGFTATPSLERMADDVAALLDALGIGRAVVGGLSMGGYVALAFARKHAARLRGLILADTRAEADSDEAKATRDKTIAFTTTHGAADVFEQLLPRALSETTRREKPEVVAELRAIAAAQTSAGVIDALKAMRDRPDSTSLLPTLTVPTLVIVGSDDILTPPAAAQAMVARLPQATLVTIPGAGHLSNMETPAAFNEAVRRECRRNVE